MYSQYVSSTAGLPDLTCVWFERCGDFTMTDILPWPGRLWQGFCLVPEEVEKEGFDGEGRDVWRGGGTERVGQINNGILSGLSSLPLSFSLSVSVSVSCPGPLLLSQADFIARPWTWAKQANSTVWLCVPVSVFVSAHVCNWQPESVSQAWQPHTHWNYQFFHAMFTSLSSSSLYLSVFSIYYTHYFPISWLSLSFRSISNHRPQGSALYDVQW